MWNMIWPVLIVVGSNTVYNICTKSTPENVNSFASLTVTYLVAAIASAIMFFITSPQKNLVGEMAGTNWTAWALGAAIVGLEFGYICLYRAGWKVSAGSLVANLMLACVLLLLGALLYRENISLRQLIGFGVCALGLVLVAK